MADGWKWASLDEQQMGLLKETEETLGADIVLAFEAGGDEVDADEASLAPAELNESQVECLEGAEEKMKAVLVAYQSAG